MICGIGGLVGDVDECGIDGDVDDCGIGGDVGNWGIGGSGVDVAGSGGGGI